MKHLCSWAEDDKNLVLYCQKSFERDAAFEAWKQGWAVLDRRCVRIFVSTHFADRPLVGVGKSFSVLDDCKTQ